MTVTVDYAAAAGDVYKIQVCEGTTTTEALLFAELTGADTGGVWSGPVTGVYTYTIAASGTCPQDTATVTVTEDEAPYAGTDGILKFCEGTTTTEALLFAE